MLANLLFGRQTSTENMDRFISDIHVLLLPENVSSRRVEFHRGLPALMKTHFMLRPDMPFFGLTAGFIYIVRNPLDVVASATNYEFLRKHSHADPKQRRLVHDRYVQDFITHGGAPDWIEARLGSWDDNVKSWAVDKPKFPGIVLKYEDMINDPVAQLTRVAAFLGLRCEPQRLQAAVEASSFDNMKAIEDREIRTGTPGFFTRESTVESLDAGYRFMSRGNPGGHKIALTDTERAQLLERFGPTMEQIGYPVHA
jgi:hypothetical protein